jgi:hypothetical protein
MYLTGSRCPYALLPWVGEQVVYVATIDLVAGRYEVTILLIHRVLRIPRPKFFGPSMIHKHMAL